MSEQTSRISLYRRWRPQRFADVVGQDEIVRTLSNAVVGGDVAHAYLFSGERGIGKTSVARILARAINCLIPSEGEPCNECANCRAIVSNRSLDIVEIDGASNRGIDHIRRLREEVNFAPADLRRKVYIIDEVHMLTTEAFNALLKTLEEPPAHAIFIFATTESHKVPRTIVSRCQAFAFRRISPDRIAAHLAHVAVAEGVTLTDDALQLLAIRAGGAVRDALVLLEQSMSYESSSITAEAVLDMLGLVGRETHEAFVRAVVENDRQTAMKTIDSLVDRGKDLEVFLADLIELLRERLAEGDVDAERDITIARGLLEIKADCFRALDRRVRLEIGVLDLMRRLAAHRQPASPRAVSRPEAPLPGDESTQTSQEETPPATEPPPANDVGSLAASTPASKRSDSNNESASTAPMEHDAKWKEFLAEIQQERIAIAAFLAEARPLLSDDKLLLSFHPAHAFHKESLEKRPNLQYLAGAARRFFGNDVRVEVAYDQTVARKPLPGELLTEKARLVCEVLDGTIVKEET